jgi:predicted dehydrogenase
MVKGIEETKKVVDKVSSMGKIFQTGHQWHSSRLYTHVVEKIKEGDLGEIADISCQWVYSLELCH